MPGPLERPRAVATASVLWIILGVIVALGAVGLAGGGSTGAAVQVSGAALLVALGMGVLIVVLAVAMRRGANGARITLTVLGALLMLGLWPVLLVVPALVLQYQAGSNAWFAAMSARRA